MNIMSDTSYGQLVNNYRPQAQPSHGAKPYGGPNVPFSHAPDPRFTDPVTGQEPVRSPSKEDRSVLNSSRTVVPRPAATPTAPGVAKPYGGPDVPFSHAPDPRLTDPVTGQEPVRSLSKEDRSVLNSSRTVIPMPAEDPTAPGVAKPYGGPDVPFSHAPDPLLTDPVTGQEPVRFLSKEGLFDQRLALSRMLANRLIVSDGRYQIF